jgi:cytochrome c-type biogenesis protein
VLPLVLGYLSYIAGQSIMTRAGVIAPALRIHTVGLSLCFVLGFTTVFVALGASATALGRLLISHRYELNLIGGAIVIGFGLFVLGVVRPSWLQRDFHGHLAVPAGRPVAAYVLGMAFAFGWSPCIGPILGSILTASAASATVAKGVTLLATYSLGLGIPFVLAAAFTDGLLARLRSIGRMGRVVYMLAGGTMIIMGAAMITGQLSTFSFWLLEAFPLLSSIG